MSTPESRTAMIDYPGAGVWTIEASSVPQHRVRRVLQQAEALRQAIVNQREIINVVAATTMDRIRRMEDHIATLQGRSLDGT